MSQKSLLAAVLACASIAGCGSNEPGAGGGGLGGGGGSGGGAAGNAPTWHEDVQPIVARSCESCHTPGAIAPFPLRSYEEAKPWHAAMRRAVEDRTMPPWLAGDDCNTYQEDPSLTNEEIAILAAWSEAGAPEGTAVAPAAASTGAGLDRVDFELPMPEAYTPQQDPDDYRCFLLEWPASETSFITGFQAVPGAPTEVHHVIAFLIEPDLVDDAEALDASEEGPGWTCFAGPGVGSGRSSFHWLGAWAPGSNGAEFPEGTGLRIEPGSRIALQIHYNTLTAGAVPDRTKLQFRVEESVEHEALVIPFTSPDWTGSDAMSIPAGEADVKHSWALPLSLYASFVDGDFSASEPLLLHAAALHMHELGTKASLRLNREENACVLDIPTWDFHWQSVFNLAEPMRVESSDQLRITCHWDNTAENQPVVDGERLPPKDVAWGEGTRDEMCLGILYVTKAPAE